MAARISAGSAVDPKHGYLYVVSKDLPAMLKLSLADPPSKTDSPQLRPRSLYQANCGRCHLENLQGVPPAIPSLVGLRRRLSDNQIRTIVANGKGLMPPFAKLTSEEIDLILSYLADPMGASADASQIGFQPMLEAPISRRRITKAALDLCSQTVASL